jgi:alpha-aminoadipate carrier protein LysW
VRTNLNIECKDCGAEMKVPNDSVVGEIVTCPDCGADFEITSKVEDKIELKPAESVGEDWGQ